MLLDVIKHNENTKKIVFTKNTSKVFKEFFKGKYFSFKKFKCKCKYFSKVFKMHLNANICICI